MAGVDFTKCEFVEPKFIKVKFLPSVIFDQLKILKSNKWIEVNSFDNFEDIIHKMED
jgi:hypothetical protein